MLFCLFSDLQIYAWLLYVTKVRYINKAISIEVGVAGHCTSKLVHNKTIATTHKKKRKAPKPV